MSLSQAGSRVRTGILILLLLACALGTFWLLEAMRRSHREVESALPKGKPDYTVENFHFVRMSKTGQARYNISGMKLTHYPYQDTFEIQQPRLHSLETEQSSMLLRSERATVDNSNNRIHMYRHVQVDRPASEKRLPFHLTSEYLLVLPQEDILQTNQPVEMTLGQARLTGIGMLANNATRELRLLTRVRGTFPPPAP